MKKQKKTYTNIIQWSIVIVAYTYLAYRLITFHDYATFATYFTHITTTQIFCILGAIALFPINIAFESLKWRCLLQHIDPTLTFREAQRQTYYGFVGAFFTPSRIGDYPSRALHLKHKEHWLSAIALGLVGSIILTLVIGIFGLPAMLELFIKQDILQPDQVVGSWPYSWIIAAFTFCVLLVQCLPAISRWIEKHYLFRKAQTQQIIHTLGQLRTKHLLKITGWTILRYIIFCIQLWLILIACDVQSTTSIITYQWLLAIPTYYLLLTVTPTIPIADIAIKGSWAIIIFSAIGGNVANITMTTVLIWCINTVAPMLIGTLVKRNT